jgi:hypothetical protein
MCLQYYNNTIITNITRADARENDQKQQGKTGGVPFSPPPTAPRGGKNNREKKYPTMKLYPIMLCERYVLTSVLLNERFNTLTVLCL